MYIYFTLVKKFITGAVLMIKPINVLVLELQKMMMYCLGFIKIWGKDFLTETVYGVKFKIWLGLVFIQILSADSNACNILRLSNNIFGKCKLVELDLHFLFKDKWILDTMICSGGVWVCGVKKSDENKLKEGT